MEPKENQAQIVYRIINKGTGEATGSYSRACHDEYDFNSVYNARIANCHGMFTNEDRFKIAKYKVTYELIEDNCNIEEKNKEYYKKDLKRMLGDYL